MSKEGKKVAEEISSSSNLIGKGTTIEGNIETSGNLRIEGHIHGDIRSKSKIALGHSSVVNGNVMAQNADMEGEVIGKINIKEILVLKSTANISGDIYTEKLVVEAGAIFNGTCKMGSKNEQPMAIENGQEAHHYKTERAIN